MGRGHQFCCLLYRLNVGNDPAARGSGEYCTLFSLPITTVTKSLGFGGLEVEVRVSEGWWGLVRVVSGVVGQGAPQCKRKNAHACKNPCLYESTFKTRRLLRPQEAANFKLRGKEEETVKLTVAARRQKTCEALLIFSSISSKHMFQLAPSL